MNVWLLKMKGITWALLIVCTCALSSLQVTQFDQVPPGFVNSTFTCWVDNFGFDGRTFEMRVFTMDKYYTPGGPILFCPGGEEAIEVSIAFSSNFPLIAQRLGALLVYTEHRYYGQSLPFGTESFTTPDNIKYLSPHQALADYAYFLISMKETVGDVPVIASSGSYGGVLSAWLRIKYPHLVAGALASSAPIFHFPGTANPELFYHVVTNDYRMDYPDCPEYISVGLEMLAGLAGQTEQYFSLMNTFLTCQEITSPSDVYGIISSQYLAYTYMALLDFPYPSDLVFAMPAYPANVACDVMALVQNETDQQEMLAALHQAANIFYNYTGTASCLDLTGSGFVSAANNYLSCSTLVMPMGQAGMPNDMFLPSPFDYETFMSGCQATYGRVPQGLYAQTYYGTSIPPYPSLRYISNIIFSSGTLDPYQIGAVTSQPLASGLTAIVIEGGAYSSDILAPNPADPQSVVDARAVELVIIQQWVDDALTS